MPRLFLGVPAPEELTFEAVTRRLDHHAREPKVVDPELYHVTVAFLGDTPEQEIGTIMDAARDGAAGHGPGEGMVKGIGAFPEPERASVLWAGIWNSGLKALANSVRDALRDAGVDFDDRHPFHPHLTLSRFRDKPDLSDLIDDHRDEAFGDFAVEEVHLYESTLKPDGPEYEVRDTVVLEAPA